MFRVYRLRDVVRIDPSKLDREIEEVAFEELRKRYEGLKDRNLGIVLAITNIKVDPIGYIPMGDGAPYHRVEFDVLTYTPIVGEILEGIVETIGRMGITIRIGPIEGFVHISQISDDEIRYDPVSNTLICKNTKRVISQGDIVRARITTVSLGPQQRLPRINMTMKQPYLGKLEWIESSSKKS